VITARENVIWYSTTLLDTVALFATSIT